MPFYAVRKGECPGIYYKWIDCFQQINGYKGSTYKKFETEEEANIFLHESPVEKIDYYVYTDGSCRNNGNSNAIAGIGIYFGLDDPRNVSKNRWKTNQ